MQQNGDSFIGYPVYWKCVLKGKR